MISLRSPRSEDGARIHHLVSACPPLDENSRYCNLLQVSHFADTSIVAEKGDELVGFVTGYLMPNKPDVLFVWQVAVSDSARGHGLAGRMLKTLLASQPNVTHVETTVTPDNASSGYMFERFAASMSTGLQRSVLFSQDEHFEGEHNDELLYRIGPLGQSHELS